MNNQYEVGMFGKWNFTIRTKRPSGYYDTPLSIEGAMVTEIDSKYVYLRGTDGVCYCPEKKRITLFEPLQKINIE